MTQATTPQPPAPPSDTVTLTIDGRTVTARKGTLLIEAAKQVGIDIPIFCYHPKMKPVGACRMCLVHVEKLPRLQTACTTPVAADMVVHTSTPDVVAAQNGVIEFLLENHPLDCPICDKGGECPLQDNAFGYGLGISRFTEEKRHKEKAYPLSDRIVLDRERCIMCYRCVRFHQEITGDEALAALERGGESEIGTLPGEPYDSIFSGNTIELCPVGALTSGQYRFKARPWDLVRTPSVCNGCAVGCNVEVHSRLESVLRLVARENPAVDDGWLCDVGRFDTLPAPSPRDAPGREVRPDRPLVRDAGGVLRPAGWDEAAHAVARRLRAGSAGLLASPGLSNEALWLLQQTLVPALGQASGVAPGAARAALWPPIGGHWPVEGAIARTARARAVVLVGLDVWNELPVLALWLRKGALSGARLVVIGAANGLCRDTTHWLRAAAGAEAAVASAVLAAIDGAPAGPVGDVSQADILGAAAALRGVQAPAVLLAGTALAADPGARATLERFAERIGANGETGLVGAPGLGANARGAQELAPELAQADPRHVLAGAASGAIETLLLLGDEPWGELPTGGARLVVATSRPVGDDTRVDVLLPLAHPYERQGTLTNLEGRIQCQDGGAMPPPRARADWGAVGELARALGLPAPGRLEEVRARIAAAAPGLAWPFASGAKDRQGSDARA